MSDSTAPCQVRDCHEPAAPTLWEIPLPSKPCVGKDKRGRTCFWEERRGSLTIALCVSHGEDAERLVDSLLDVHQAAAEAAPDDEGEEETTMSELITPTHERWGEFTIRLAGEDGCDWTREGWTCFGDHRFSRSILQAMGLDAETIRHTLGYFIDHGGHCDCEVLLNVDRHEGDQEAGDEEDDEHGNDLAQVPDGRDECADCGTYPAHYMVLDDVWKAAGMSPDGGYLCVLCLERRIGRRLTPDDFDGCPMNQHAFNLALVMDRIAGAR